MIMCWKESYAFDIFHNKFQDTISYGGSIIGWGPFEKIIKIIKK
jgi:hypothetical protein